MRAKFRVSSITAGEASAPDGSKKKVSESLQAMPVYESDPTSTNYSWSQYTPSGNLQLNITNPDAFDHFTVGQEIFVTLTPVAQPNTTE